MNWIVKILKIEPYTITCMWNDNEVRSIDLSGFLAKYSGNPKNSYYQLLDKNRFLQAKCDGSTIYWENGLRMKDFDGSIKPGPLDFDPQVLFEMTLHTKDNSISKT
jgi:hypothetical protein